MKKTVFALALLSTLTFGVLADAEEQTVDSQSTGEIVEQTPVSDEVRATEKEIVEQINELRMLEESPRLQREVVVDEYMIQEDPSLGAQPRAIIYYDVILRLYNPNSGAHFYTKDYKEANDLVSLGWRNEGMAWQAPTYLGSPVYRLYNVHSGEHFYTIRTAEKDMLTANGWNYEKVAFRAASNQANYAGRPVYRLFNPNAGPYRSSHHYTVNYNEVTNLVGQGWRNEGAVFWVG